MTLYGAIWILAAIVWYSAVLYGRAPYNRKFGFQRADGEEVVLDGLSQGIVIARPCGQASRVAFFP
jgi:hypothetical protein